MSRTAVLVGEERHRLLAEDRPLHIQLDLGGTPGSVEQRRPHDHGARALGLHCLLGLEFHHAVFRDRERGVVFAIRLRTARKDGVATDMHEPRTAPGSRLGDVATALDDRSSVALSIREMDDGARSPTTDLLEHAFAIAHVDHRRWWRKQLPILCLRSDPEMLAEEAGPARDEHQPPPPMGPTHAAILRGTVAARARTFPLSGGSSSSPRRTAARRMGTSRHAQPYDVERRLDDYSR